MVPPLHWNRPAANLKAAPNVDNGLMVDVEIKVLGLGVYE